MAIERAEYRRAMIIVVALVVSVALVLLLLVMIWRRTITNRSARTVDTIKYSLRKKMQVDESMPTVAYLRKFL